MNLKGKLLEVKKEEVINDSLTKQIALVETGTGDYKQTLAIDFYNDKRGLLSNFQKGTDVSIGINIKCREWTNKQGVTQYFTTLVGWKVEENQEVTQNQQNTNRELDDLAF